MELVEKSNPELEEVKVALDDLATYTVGVFCGLCMPVKIVDVSVTNSVGEGAGEGQAGEQSGDAQAEVDLAVPRACVHNTWSIILSRKLASTPRACLP